MVKRLLDANASDFRGMKAHDLIESIRLSEGRAILAEVISAVGRWPEIASEIDIPRDRIQFIDRHLRIKDFH